jgi:hypothetical protein
MAGTASVARRALATATSVALVLAFNGAGCSSVSTNPAGSAPADGAATQPTADGSIAFGCGGGELYVPKAMNAKLRHFPDFAASAGVPAVVVDCATGRAFMAAYSAYELTHPGFDANQPLDAPPLPARPPLPPPHAPAVFEVKKILNGTPVQNAPVVKVTGGPAAPVDSGLGPDSPGGCSGTFIAKNWIVTAAHCVATFPFTNGTYNGDPNFTPSFFPVIANLSGWFKWTVDWADTSGNQIGPDGSVPGPQVAAELRTIALQYPDPRWVGYSQNYLMTGASWPNDFALLYIFHDDDPFLPPNPEAFGSTMRVSLKPPALSETPTYYGWGAPFPLTSQVGTYPSTFKVDSFADSVVVPPSYTGPAICHGDSGGPLVRTISIGPGGTQSQSIYGVLAGVFPTLPFNVCAGSGHTVYWARADQEIGWINRAMKEWNGPSFSCDELPQTGGTDPEFAQCWGQPCASDMDCQPTSTMAGVPVVTSFCDRPTAANNGVCPVCAPAQNCDCVVGQCLPLAAPNLGDDGGSDASSDDGGSE